MGNTPKDLEYVPELGDVLEIAYEVNKGVAAAERGETVGEVSKIFGDDEFLGFRLKVRETNHGDAIEKIDVKADKPHLELDVYASVVYNSGEKDYYKVNVIPGAVTIEEIR